MSTPEQQLATLRAEIDQLDSELIMRIKARCAVVEKVAALKQAHWPSRCHIRPEREAQMHARIYAAFEGSNFHPEAAVAIWRHLIGASTHMESPLHVAASTTLRPLVAAYFGDYINHIAWDGETLPSQTTIAALPFPDAASAGLWQNFAQAHPDWRIFAYMPVVLHSAQPQALLLAPLTPQPSGNDISYFIGASAQAGATAHSPNLFSLQGFVTEHAGATFIGTHAIPLTA